MLVEKTNTLKRARTITSFSISISSMIDTKKVIKEHPLKKPCVEGR